MYLKLIEEAQRLMREAVVAAGYAADDMSLTESAHADLLPLPFRLAKEMKKNPKEIAQQIVSRMGKSDYFSKVEVVGAYINFFASDKYVIESLTAIRNADKKFYRLDNNGIKVILEHTSANPTGPLHVGRGRNPIIGDTLARILRNAGYNVEVQYYVDDMGKQEATIVWGFENLDVSKLQPEVDKPDHHIVEVYRAATDRRKADPEVEKAVPNILNRYEHGDPEVSLKLKKYVELCLEGQRMTLDRMNVFYDRFVWESGFVFDGEVDRIVKQLAETPYARRNADELTGTGPLILRHGQGFRTDALGRHVAVHHAGHRLPRLEALQLRPGRQRARRRPEARHAAARSHAEDHRAEEDPGHRFLLVYFAARRPHVHPQGRRRQHGRPAGRGHRPRPRRGRQAARRPDR